MRATTPALAVLLALTTIACRKADPPEGVASPGSSPSSSASAPATATPRAPKEFVLPSGDRKVRVRFVPPAGWTDNEREGFVSLQGKWQSLLYVSMTCDGNCSEKPADMRKNILASAKEAFGDYGAAKSDPPYEVRWIQEPKEDPPNVITWELMATHAERKLMKHKLTIERIMPEAGRILRCEVTIDEREPADAFEKVAAICRALTPELLPKGT